MEIRTNEAGTARSEPPLWFQVVSAALVAAVYFAGLNVPLMGPDEPRYAQAAREMYERGDWLTPTLGGVPWFEKPPLLYWLEIASYHVFGVNEFSARLGPTLCGLAIAAAFWTLGKREAGTSLLALMAAASVGLIAFSHAATFDVVLVFTMTWALASFWNASEELSASHRTLWLAAFYVFTGLAVLAKGLVGILFPFGIISLFCVVSRRLPQRFVISLVWGIPLLLLIATPWHIAMLLRNGEMFIVVYFIQHHFQRFATNKYLHPQPFYFFWWVLPLLALPWTLFAIAALIKSFRKLTERLSPLLLLALCWLAVPLVFFSFSGSKLPGYILPSVPPIVLIAWLWLRERPWKMAGAVCVATIALSLIGIVAYLPTFAARDSVKDLIADADARGYSSSRVLTLFMISHNAEFYAAGRLLRNSDGEQVMLEGVQLVRDEITKDGKPVLVLVPVEYASQLTSYSEVKTEILADNGSTAIAAVAPK